MLKILDVIPIPFNVNSQVDFIMNRYTGNDSFSYCDYTVSLNTDYLKRLNVIALFEKDNKQLFIEMFCLMTRDLEIHPIIIKYRDFKNTIHSTNELVVLNNIKNLIYAGMIHYSTNDSDIIKQPSYGTTLSVYSFYDRIVPREYEEIQEYMRDPSYNGFTKLTIPENADSIKAKLESVVHIGDIRNNNRSLTIYPEKENYDRYLFNNFEYILFGMNPEWTVSFIKELKMQLLDSAYIARLVKHRNNVPQTGHTPIALLDRRETKGKKFYVNDNTLDLYESLLLLSLSDIDVIFNDIIYDVSLSKVNIMRAYSSLFVNSIGERERLSILKSLRKKILSWMVEYQFHKSRVPIDIRVRKNFYGELILTVNVHNEPIYSFEMDLFMFVFASEGIDISI